MSDTMGWLPCERHRLHQPHEWTYTDPATGLADVAFCDGATLPTPERACCADPLCPCGGTRPGWSTSAAGSMNYPQSCRRCGAAEPEEDA